MATSTGKSIGLVLLAVLALLIVLRMSPFFIAPFGWFTGIFQGLRSPGIKSLHFGPYGFHLSSLSILSLVFLILWIAVIVWVYRDAERRNMNGVLWALLVFIGNLIGLLIYLIVRTDNEPVPLRNQSSQTTHSCPNCQKPVYVNFTYCPHCGIPLESVCPQCCKQVEQHWNVCPHCGGKLKSDK